MTVRRLVLALLLCVVGLSALSAQSIAWELDMSRDGALPSELWTGDRGDYVYEDGQLTLRAGLGRSSSLITTPITLGEDSSWQGYVRMAKLPTSQNYSYILLAQLAEQGTELRYLALAFGGRQNRVSLCEASFSRQASGGYKHEPQRDRPLIETPHLPAQILTGLSYQVHLSREGDLVLYLSEDKPSEAQLVGRVEYATKPSRSTRFGLYSSYSPGQREGFFASDLRLLHGAIGTEPQPALDSPVTSGEGGETDFLLSEIMANPLLGSVEYIELYHAGDLSRSLEEYSIGLGASRSDVKTYDMRRLGDMLSPRAYYVLTTNPDALLEAYPSADRTKIIKVKLPQLRNAGFVLQLYRGKSLVDEVVYNPQTWERGIRSKRGIAYERTRMQAGDGAWRPAAKSYGYASPTEASGQLASGGGVNGHAEADGESISALIDQLERNPSLRAELKIYDLVGTPMGFIGYGASLDTLRAIRSNPYQVLKDYVPTHSPCLLLVYLYDAEGSYKVYDFKFILR